MSLLRDILQRGYFPAELPPPFNTEIYSNILSDPTLYLPHELIDYENSSKCLKHNLVRNGTLRRILGIPNPVNYFHIGLFIAKNWSELSKEASKSKISLSKAIHSASNRAISKQTPRESIVLHQAKARSGFSYLLITDISRCYPSIYTHSIPWAIHSKKIAKVKRGPALYGNTFDKLIRNAQDNQTLGIPIGPDSSFLIAEIILSKIDDIFSSKSIFQGFRYIDDYEFGFSSLSEAEKGLAAIHEALNEYELALNPQKTKIIKLPHPLEPNWVSELRSFQFRTSIKSQQYDIIRFFDRSFQMAILEPNEAILKYSISLIDNLDIFEENWTVCENLLFQCLINETGTISRILKMFLIFRSKGFPINTLKFREILQNIILKHAPLGHGSEVAWSLWSCREFELRIEDTVAERAVEMQDSIVWLIVLDLISNSLISSKISLDVMKSKMVKDELYQEHWLLSYEANIKSWLPSLFSKDHVSDDPIFGYFKKSGISFYDDKLRIKLIPSSTLSDTEDIY